MVYHLELSVNALKETKITEIEDTITEAAHYYKCSDLYYNSEEDGTKKIPQYQLIFVIYFLENNFDNFIQFVKFVKCYKPSVIECIYDNAMNKLLYASSYYLRQIDKSISKKYKQFMRNRLFTSNETKLLQEFM
jgi:hypothetical protein